jgi:hypothetical protein
MTARARRLSPDRQIRPNDPELRPELVRDIPERGQRLT